MIMAMITLWLSCHIINLSSIKSKTYRNIFSYLNNNNNGNDNNNEKFTVRTTREKGKWKNVGQWNNFDSVYVSSLSSSFPITFNVYRNNSKSGVKWRRGRSKGKRKELAVEYDQHDDDDDDNERSEEHK